MNRLKLIIQIPCFNEEHSLPITWECLPKSLPEFPNVDIFTLIIDDGSTDNTVKVAKKLGIDYIITQTGHKGLAKGWSTGIQACLNYNADIIINLDADNQYDASAIPNLIRPILEGKADMVIGARKFDEIPYFSPTKRRLQKLGSWCVSQISGLHIEDATSGFRAYSRYAASCLNVFSNYTYTLETILHAGEMKLTVVNVPVNSNAKLRESRLLKSMSSYIRKSLITLVRIGILYSPFKFFLFLSTIFFIPGVLLGLRFITYWVFNNGEGKIQSLILCAVLLLISVQLLGLGILAYLSSTNRSILEKVYAKQKDQSNCCAIK